jgi:imidazole glycerol-phosphate synthase subunit HisH
MRKTVSIVDYGLGNLHSVIKSAQHLGAEVRIADTSAAIRDADRLILPGVGAFSDGMNHLYEHGQDEGLRNYIVKGRPLLGICLGAQLLFDESEEFGVHRGLAVIPGKVTAIPRGKVRVPHVGWAKVIPSRAEQQDSLMKEAQFGRWMYFVHSYCMQANSQEDVSATCTYGPLTITAIVQKGMIYGCQFHPEKSGRHGLALLNNFLEL